MYFCTGSLLFRVSLSHLPAGLTPVQIPVLLRISDYAKRLSAEKNLSFEQFLKEQWGTDLLKSNILLWRTSFLRLSHLEQIENSV